MLKRWKRGWLTGAGGGTRQGMWLWWLCDFELYTTGAPIDIVLHRFAMLHYLNYHMYHRRRERQVANEKWNSG